MREREGMAREENARAEGGTDLPAHKAAEGKHRAVATQHDSGTPRVLLALSHSG